MIRDSLTILSSIPSARNLIAISPEEQLTYLVVLRMMALLYEDAEVNPLMGSERPAGPAMSAEPVGLGFYKSRTDLQQ